MVEETSLITGIFLAKAETESQFVLEFGLPDAATLASHFVRMPIFLERANVESETSLTPQGPMVSTKVNFSCPRSFNLNHFLPKRLAVYVTKSNGEKDLYGSKVFPGIMTINAASSTTASDDGSNSITISMNYPL